MTSSSGPTSNAYHPFLWFSQGPHEDLHHHLGQRLSELGHCIDWATLKQIHLADRVSALIVTDPWDRFFSIIEPTYSELAVDFCLTFILQHVILSHDNSCTISFRLGNMMRHLSIPDFGVALGLYTKEFMSCEGFLTLY